MNKMLIVVRVFDHPGMKGTYQEFHGDDAPRQAVRYINEKFMNDKSLFKWIWDNW